jgi:hypothetical protein
MVSTMAFLVGTIAAAPARAGELEWPLAITVEAGEYPRKETPVSLALPGLPEKLPALQLVETTDGKAAPVAWQLEEGRPPRLWWILTGETPAGGRRTFEWKAGPAIGGAGIRVTGEEGFLEVHRGEAKVLRYNSAHVPPTPGLDEKYGRSAFIHPVWTPGGAVVTDQFSPDHPHQDGIFLAYTKTEFEGRQPNFWDLLGGKGRVRFAAHDATTSGPVFGGFRVRHEHVDLGIPGGKVALVETWDVRVWNVGGPKDDFWVFDLTSAIRPATGEGLRLPKYHYGGMAIRGAREWKKDRCRFLTSEGKDRLAGNHTRIRWCDMSGTSEGRWSGVTLMTHPGNFRFPEPIRIHPDMPYMVYTPSVLGDWEIKPGADHRSRYRWLVHDGELHTEQAERLWRDFAEPPRVRVVTKG